MVTTGLILLAIPVALVAYAYFVYPAILWVIARGRRPGTFSRSELPLVSIVVPAYNEATQIRGTIEALIGQDYPAHLRQILILSDASTDGTDQIVDEYREQGVELLRMPSRSGKTAAENASCALLRGQIVINSDASVRLHQSAVRRLVETMADPRIGVASTRDVSVSRSGGSANVTEAGYVDYEMRVRALETQTGGIVGASGSGYAILAHLHRIPVRQDLSRDFSAALTARTHGFAAVSVDDAICFVPRTTSLRAEYKRKVRTIARGAETLLFQRHLLDATHYGLFSWKLLSHKVARWLVPPSAIPGAIGLVMLASTRALAGVTIAIMLAGILVALLGARWPEARPMPRPLSIFTFAVAANTAVIHALLRVLFGFDDHVWEPTRRTPELAQS